MMNRATIHADHEVCMQKMVVRMCAERSTLVKLTKMVVDSVVFSDTEILVRRAEKSSGIRGGEPSEELYLRNS